ncbi:MAG TPA: histidinol-phosphate transaminase [Acidimicrobiales bacterium]
MTTTRVQPRGDLALMTGYHSPQLDVPVRLNTNESPVGPPTAWVDELAAALADVAWNRYPDREAVALRSALADHHATTLDRVFCANGSNEVLQSVLLAYGGAGRTAATFEPTYAVHSHLARVTGTAVIAGERGDDFALERDEVERVLAQGPGVVFLCSPDNPTGLVADPDLVASVADRCAAAGALLVVDEAYGQFASSTALDLVDDDRPLLVTRTFSKTWAMAAGRLGYGIGPAWVVDELLKVALPYHLDAVTQLAGCLALGHTDDMDERVRLIVRERERLVAGLGRLPLRQWPSGANFVLFRPEGASGDAVWQALVEEGVLVRNCASWPRLTDCLRVTVGTPDENDRFLTALEEIL